MFVRRIHHAVVLMVLNTCALSADAVEIVLPQGRTVFQTNEWIDISVARSSGQPLKSGDLLLELKGDGGSRLAFTFPVEAGGTSKTEHLHVNGGLLRPGKYQVVVDVDDEIIGTEIEVCSHIRQSSFRLINWGRADKREEQLVQGEESFGFNLFYGGYARDDEGHFMRAGVDFMANCVMSGGHQMDLRTECDWSDPYVTKGGTRRVVRRAMFDRTRPNVPGVHFYDEPGLTWHKHPVTGEWGPHGVPAQIRSYEAAFGRTPPEYYKLDPSNADDVARWHHWATWKLGLMDAAWKDAQFGVSRVRPDFLSVTQSQYGWTAFTDGYYFNVARSLPVTSGHGGYHDFGLGIFNPSYFLEMSRARDRWKPCWYLPTWYGSTTADQFRLEQYLSFQTNVQGMISPPDCEPARNAGPRQGIVESNHLLKKLGTIFTTMPPTKPPVALLYSLSQCIHTQTKDRSQNYAHAIPHGRNLPLAYLAGKLIQHQFFAVLDEDVLDGTLANDHRAIVLTSLDYLDPAVIAALEDFAQSGGLVLLTADCAVKIKGAKKLPLAPRLPDQEKYDALAATGNWQQAAQYATVALQMQGALPLGRAIDAELRAAGIGPVFECDQSTIVATRHAIGDVEYLFAVNATPDGAARNDKGEPLNNQLLPATATITLPDDGRPVYDAVLSHILHIPEDSKLEYYFGHQLFAPEANNRLAASFRFGPGQMRVFARTTRPISRVRLSQPTVDCDLLREADPIVVELSAALVDTSHQHLNGSFPLHVRVVDPTGATRYDLFRATKLGQLQLRLPLGVNDPAGEWKVIASDQLAGTLDVRTFIYTPPRRPNSLAGATWRAVFTAGDDANAFRFARTFQDVTIVAGSSDFNAAAVERLTRILAPWGVRCKTMPLAEASRSRTLTEDEARTWAGLVYAGSGQIKPGAGNPPAIAGFAVRGPVILLGNPQDNAIIDFLHKEKFLPYTIDANMPGPRRGLFAWQRDGIGAGQESISLIAHDAAGMAEAVGSFYEAVAGIEPLTRWARPNTVDLAQATAVEMIQSKASRLSALLPDRVIGLKLTDDGVRALTHDHSLLSITWRELAIVAGSHKLPIRAVSDAAEFTKLASELATPIDAALLADFQRHAPPNRLLKFVVPHGSQRAGVYWGGEIELRERDGNLVWRKRFDQDISAIASDGDQLVLGLADGRLMDMR